MTTSYTYTRDQIIQAALRTQGWLDYTATPDATKVSQMNEALNLLIKSWSARGTKFWVVLPVTVPLVAAKASYTWGPYGGADIVGDRPLRIEEVYARQTGGSTDIPVERLSLREYVLLGNKTTAGPPTQIFFDPTWQNSTLYVYPVPADNTWSLILWTRRYLSDVVNPTDIVEFPAEWYKALVFGLADQTALENQVPPAVADRIAVRAAAALMDAEGWDREYASTYIGIDPSVYAGYRRVL